MCIERRVPRTLFVISGSLIIAIEVSPSAHVVVFRDVASGVVSTVFGPHFSFSFICKPLKWLVNPSTRIETDPLRSLRGDSLCEATPQAVACDSDSVSGQGFSDSCQCSLAALEPLGAGQLASGELDISGKVPSSPRSSSSESDDGFLGSGLDEDFGFVVTEGWYKGCALGYNRLYIVGFFGEALEFCVAEVLDQGASS